MGESIPISEQQEMEAVSCCSDNEFDEQVVEEEKECELAINILNSVVAEMSSRNNVPPLTYSAISTIGQGTFGSVCLCQRQDDIQGTQGQYWAQRLVLKTSMKDNSQYEREKRILNILKGSSFTTQCLGCFQSGNLDIIVLPFYPGGDLYTHLNERWPLPGPDVVLYCAEIGTALHYMHEQNVIYLDLKAENVLITQTGHVRLVDFGISVVLDESNLTPQGRFEVVSEAGTLPYCAPEILKRQSHSFESDWWSLGVLLFEMLVGYAPFMTSDDPQDICQSICNLPFEVPDDVYQDNVAEFHLVEILLKKHQRLRLGYNDGDFEYGFKQHEFFQKYDLNWDALNEEEISPSWVPDLETAIDTKYFQPDEIQ